MTFSMTARPKAGARIRSFEQGGRLMRRGIAVTFFGSPQQKTIATFQRC